MHIYYGKYGVSFIMLDDKLQLNNFKSNSFRDDNKMILIKHERAFVLFKNIIY